jgi:8-oxo-dGTP pyrophosphatase MutT (NUDIX family)
MPQDRSVVFQAGVIAVRNGRVCLVSSSSGKRWVIPKGCLEAGKSVAEIALQEAWEEAGLHGELCDEPLGSYYHRKADRIQRVTVFAMEVTEAARDWPEKFKRRRIWLGATKAGTQVEQPGLQFMLRVFAEQTQRKQGNSLRFPATFARVPAII